LAQIVAALREGSGGKPNLFSLPVSLFESALRIAGRSDLWERLGASLIVDTSKLASAGWRPQHDTETGLRRLAQTDD
jgi:hypothetical protein